MKNVKQLSLFFFSLDYIKYETVGVTDNVNCASNMNENTQCKGYHGEVFYFNSIHSLRRIDINVDTFIGYFLKKFIL